MRNCAEIRARLALYVDSELSGPEALEFEAHLTGCAGCRRAYDQLRGVVDAVRGASPLYEAPEHSYAAASELVAEFDRGRRQRRWAMAAVAAAAILAVSFIWVRAGRSEYEHFAVQAHFGYARGVLPLDVVSSQPRVVSDWLSSRVPFHLTLPNYPEGGRKRYALAGARLMQYRGEEVAYLAYEMDHKPISLLISSSPRIVPTGGETYQSRGLRFYFSAEQGLRIITWKDKGLVYAQVSDLDVKGAESCAICHGGEGERPKFEGLGKRM